MFGIDIYFDCITRFLFYTPKMYPKLCNLQILSSELLICVNNDRRLNKKQGLNLISQKNINVCQGEVYEVCAGFRQGTPVVLVSSLQKMLSLRVKHHLVCIL